MRVDKLLIIVLMNVSLLFVSGLIIFKSSKAESFHIDTISSPSHLAYLLEDPKGLA